MANTIEYNNKLQGLIDRQANIEEFIDLFQEYFKTRPDVASQIYYLERIIESESDSYTQEDSYSYD